MAKFLVLYRGGDGSKLTPKQNDTLMQKWGAIYGEAREGARAG